MDYSSLDLEVMESHLDWLTCTAKRGPHADDLIGHTEGRLLDNRDHGDHFDDWGFQGYKGWQCGDARWGWGREGAIVVLSQEGAHALAPKAAELADHWSRVDYATTILDRKGEIQPDNDYFNLWLRLHPNGKGPIHLSRQQTAGGGGTIVLGTRASSRYTRVYDKHAETKGLWPKGSWRYECELKREQSEGAQTTWRTTIPSLSYIAAMSVAHLHDYKLPIPFKVERYPTFAGVPPRQRDSARALRWLETQVAPTVQWLAQAVGREEVQRALNI